MELNRQKTEVVLHPRAPPSVHEPFAAQGFDTSKTASFFKLLGAPCGTDTAQAAEFVKNKTAAQTRRLHLVRAIDEPQQALALLRYCGAQPLGNYYARAVGEIARESFEDLDRETADVFDAVVLQIPSGNRVAKTLLNLPARFGGVGLRSIAAVAPMAFAASSVSANALLKKLVPEVFLERLALDPFAAEALPQPSSVIARFPPVVEKTAAYFDQMVPTKRAQHELTKKFDEALSEEMMAEIGAMNVHARARINSARADFASAWLSPLPGAEAPFWLPSASFLALLRVRLGLVVNGRERDCVYCSRPGVVDVMGYHSTLCGNKYALHNSVRNFVATLFEDALWAPRLEPNAFPSAPGRRGDIIVSIPGAGNGRAERVVVDVSVVSPFAAARLSRAALAPGGAAELAAEEKLESYSDLPAEAGVRLVPLCVDSLGAWNEEGLKLLKKAARAYGRRFDMSASRAIPLCLASISTVLAGEIARNIVANTAPVDTPPGLPGWSRAPATAAPLENPAGGPTAIGLRARRAPETNDATRAELGRAIAPPPPSAIPAPNDPAAAIPPRARQTGGALQLVIAARAAGAQHARHATTTDSQDDTRHAPENHAEHPATAPGTPRDRFVWGGVADDEVFFPPEIFGPAGAQRNGTNPRAEGARQHQHQHQQPQQQQQQQNNQRAPEGAGGETTTEAAFQAGSSEELNALAAAIAVGEPRDDQAPEGAGEETANEATLQAGSSEELNAMAAAIAVGEPRADQDAESEGERTTTAAPAGTPLQAGSSEELNALAAAIAVGEPRVGERQNADSEQSGQTRSNATAHDGTRQNNDAAATRAAEAFFNNGPGGAGSSGFLSTLFVASSEELVNRAAELAIGSSQHGTATQEAEPRNRGGREGSNERQEEEEEEEGEEDDDADDAQEQHQRDEQGADGQTAPRQDGGLSSGSLGLSALFDLPPQTPQQPQPQQE